MPARSVPNGRVDETVVRSAHDRFLTHGDAPGVRRLIAESWQRSADAGVDVDALTPPLLALGEDLAAYREAHPLARVFPVLYDVLGRAAEELESVMAVGDAHGQLLWVCGHPSVLRRADGIGFVEGSAWSERYAGTNAPGTALRLDRPVQVAAGEHFARPVQQWSCAAAPIHDPVTQAVLGIVDVTGTDDIASPQTLAMVRAAARMAESELGRLMTLAPDLSRAEEVGVAPAPGQIAAAGLGRPDCLLELDGRAVRLSPRHSEILVILADRPDGLTGDELAVELYTDDVRTSTTRAELTRLRGLLGNDVLGSRPYRLRSPISCDWHAVGAAIDVGRPAAALRAYRGPLLPHSDAPGVVERRDRLHRQLRAAVLCFGEVDLMAAWTRSRWGADDREVWLRQRELAPGGSPISSIARAELRRLDHELGVKRGRRLG